MSDEREYELQEGHEAETPDWEISESGEIKVGGEVVGRAPVEFVEDRKAEREALSPQPEPSPTQAPAVGVEDVALYHRLKDNDIHFEDTVDALRTYAATLPEQEQQRLSTDFKTFNQAYLRARAVMVQEHESPEDRQRIIREAKEDVKTRLAPVERPGVAPRELSRGEEEATSRGKRLDYLMRKAQNAPAGRREDYLVDYLAEKAFAEPTRRGGTNY